MFLEGLQLLKAAYTIQFSFIPFVYLYSYFGWCCSLGEIAIILAWHLSP